MHITTKLQTVLFIFFASFFIVNPSKAQGSFDRNQTLLLITDKSLQKDSMMNLKVERFIKQKLRSFLTQNDKQVCLSFIFENSASAANQFCRYYNVPPIDENGLSDRQLQQQKIKLKAKKFKTQNRLIRDVMNYYKTDTRLAGSSAILSCISRISNTDTKTVEVIFFSDFIENSSIRNMYKSLLHNRETALRYASEDVKKLTKLFDLKALKDKQITVLCILTVDPMDIRASNAHLEDYWKEIFRLLGITQIKFSTLH